ncbi:glutamate receptor ionotropic, delta-2 isoform X2 [Hylaeus volcanicus]|uniref:glutamate receptor ionotropic, delta-2 isoform X2 n=1 Tax=Hylaeus volcanicus TaxID=313075 RepID=UPI0023B7772F|nr:glutamate receptor ionotropic, delta-2 isoform X2 [Hylaeus volcanicus]
MLFSRALLVATVVWLQHCTRCVDSQGNVANEADDKPKTPIPSHVTVTSWNDMPFSGIVEENGKWIGKGYAFYILDLLSSKLNFSYTIIPPREHILGNENSGVLSLLYEKKVDIAVAYLPVLPEMRRYCTFSTFLDEMKLTALMKRPHESATGSGLLAPFERTVWILVLASLVFVGPVIYFFAYIRSKLWHDPDSERFSLTSCFWFVYSSLLKQGTNIVATTDSTRMLFATWWIFILILTSFYTANLTAFLTKPQFTLSISSLQDIVHKGYSWVTYKGRTVDFLLSQVKSRPMSTDSKVFRILSNFLFFFFQNHYNDLSLLNASKRQGKGVFKYYEPSKAILNSVSTKRLFLGEAHYLQTLIFQDYINKTRRHMDHSLRCTYVIMPGNILVTNRAFGFPLNGSIIENHINKMLLRLVETGIIQHRQEEDLPLAEICPVDLRSTERQLRNTDLLLTYKVVVAGYAIASIIFLFEIIFAFIWSRIKYSKQRDTRNSLALRVKSDHSKKNSSRQKRITFLKGNTPDIYQPPENILMQRKQELINGRNYYVVTDSAGDRRLIPIRTPSAILFQYAS